MKKTKTSNALEIMVREFDGENPEVQEALEQARTDNSVARKIYALRAKAALTQQELAQLVGTTKSVISRLEDADYEGHSLAMLTRIASALNRRVEIRFVNIAPSPYPKKKQAHTRQHGILAR